MRKNKKNEVQNPVWVPVAKLHKNSKSLDVIWVVYDHQVKRLPSMVIDDKSVLIFPINQAFNPSNMTKTNFSSKYQDAA